MSFILFFLAINLKYVVGMKKKSLEENCNLLRSHNSKILGLHYENEKFPTNRIFNAYLENSRFKILILPYSLKKSQYYDNNFYYCSDPLFNHKIRFCFNEIKDILKESKFIKIQQLLKNNSSYKKCFDLFLDENSKKGDDLICYNNIFHILMNKESSKISYSYKNKKLDDNKPIFFKKLFNIKNKHEENNSIVNEDYFIVPLQNNPYIPEYFYLKIHDFCDDIENYIKYSFKENDFSGLKSINNQKNTGNEENQNIKTKIAHSQENPQIQRMPFIYFVYKKSKKYLQRVKSQEKTDLKKPEKSANFCKNDYRSKNSNFVKPLEKTKMFCKKYLFPCIKNKKFDDSYNPLNNSVSNIFEDDFSFSSYNENLFENMENENQIFIKKTKCLPFFGMKKKMCKFISNILNPQRDKRNNDNIEFSDNLGFEDFDHCIIEKEKFISLKDKMVLAENISNESILKHLEEKENIEKCLNKEEFYYPHLNQLNNNTLFHEYLINNSEIPYFDNDKKMNYKLKEKETLLSHYLSDIKNVHEKIENLHLSYLNSDEYIISTIDLKIMKNISKNYCAISENNIHSIKKVDLNKNITNDLKNLNKFDAVKNIENSKDKINHLHDQKFEKSEIVKEKVKLRQKKLKNKNSKDMVNLKIIHRKMYVYNNSLIFPDSAVKLTSSNNDNSKDR